MAFSLKRLLIGTPLATERAHHEKLPKILALPIFASDALSSVAYASEQIMAALLVAGAAHFGLTPLLSLGIIVLLIVVATSYRQTIMAYPGGGGAYIVSRDNLGELPAQAAGAALLVDYVLTVSVSVAAGVAAVMSLLRNLGSTINSQDHVVMICIGCVLFIAVMNLRGVRESGVLFAIPTYSFIALMYLMIGCGLYKLLVLHGLNPVHTVEQLNSARVRDEVAHHAVSGLEAVTPFLVLHAFASGCTALTGVEAISNGVPAFREPSSKNAAATMVWMAAILATLFMGLSYLAVHVNALPEIAQLAGGHESLGETVSSQVGRAVFGLGPIYWALQIATALILILAANTSFNGFPLLSAIMARDGFLPRQFGNVGDKLVHNNGIIVLSVLSCVLIVAFKGSVDALIPLYAIGVFLSFTLSQAGMVRRWITRRDSGWQFKAAVNGFGAIMTFVVMIIFGVVKFMHGAYIVIFLIPMLMTVFFRIQTHYRSVARQLSLDGYRPMQGVRHHMLVLAPDIHRGVIPALQYARSLSADAKAIHVSIDPARERRVRERWTLWSRGMPLVVLPSPYRSLVDPVLHYIESLQERDPRSLVTVVIPEFVPNGWWPKLLHGQAGLMLSLRLRFKRGVVTVNVPYHIEAYVELPRHESQLGQHSEAVGAAHHEAPTETGATH